MMFNPQSSEYSTLTSRDTVLSMLETFPGALFFLDDAETIVYVNANVQTITRATHKEFLGNQFWQCAPHLVSPSLYQAVMKTKQTQERTEVEYRSPGLQTWLHVQIMPTMRGLVLQFHEVREPARCQEIVPQSEYICADILENIFDRLAILTPDGMILDINERPLEDAQVRREEIVGRPLAEIPWWSYTPAVQQQLRAAIAQASRGEIVHFEARICPQPGRYLDLGMTIIPHRDANTPVQSLLCVARNITERKHEEALCALVETIPQLVWIAGPDGSISYNNQRLIDYLAMPLEQAKGDGWMTAVHPDNLQRVREAWQAAIQTGMPYEEELRLQGGTSGAYRWFLVRGVPQRNAQGTILHWVGTCTDIDEQKQTEQRLKEGEERFRVLAEAVPQMVWTSRADGRIDHCNQRYRDYLGASPQHILGEEWRQFVHPDDYERTQALRRHARETGEPYEIEYRLLDGRTGAYRWYLTRALPVHDEAGQIVKWFGSSTDIEDQKHVEEALRESQERASALMNSNIIGIFLTEGEQIVDANDTFLYMTGYTREDLREGCINWRHMTPPEYLAHTQQAHQELATQRYMTPYEKEYMCKDGSRLPVLVGGVVLGHNPLQNIYFALDNSVRKELEQRKEDFISMASHELKTPLTALKMQIQLVRKRLERQSLQEAATALSRVEGPVKKLERLIGELLDVSKIQAGRLEYLQETVDLDALLHDVADTMQQISPTHTIVVRGAAPYSLVGDTDRLGQVFLNLLSNATKYSPDAQTVEMDLSASEEAVTIRVRDHGLGIPREQRNKIFERFYRAAGPRQLAIPGLGMGLYIVAEIVKGHGGTITVDSEVGKGSTFTVTLPRRREA